MVVLWLNSQNLYCLLWNLNFDLFAFEYQRTRKNRRRRRGGKQAESWRKRRIRKNKKSLNIETPSHKHFKDKQNRFEMHAHK